MTGETTMKRLIARWMQQSFEEMRVLGPVATGAFVAGGAFNSLAVMLVWLVQHHSRHEPQP
jgi:hypothetical protein